MGFTEITFEKDSGLARITLNRPDKVNALSRAMVADLDAALLQAGNDPDVRAVILCGAGKHFCAGHQMDEMLGLGASEAQDIFANCSAMMQRIRRLPQPVIARVQGVATAAGCQLVAACDLAIAATNARFGTPGVRIGLFCGTPAVPLVRAVGQKRALEMLMTGRWVLAEEALAWGLVNQLVHPDELAAKAETFARQIIEASPATLAHGKRVFYEQIDLDERQAYDLVVPAMGLNLGFEDAQEGMGAFLEKREPVWRGK